MLFCIAIERWFLRIIVILRVEFLSDSARLLQLPHYGHYVFVDGRMVQSNPLSRILYARA
jgi:hypothetical protein